MEFTKETTKNEYHAFLNETLYIFANKYQRSPNYLFQIIIEQLLDIQANMVENGNLNNWDKAEINERYTLGGIAVKNFEEHDVLRKRLQDTFYGALHYRELMD